MTKKTLGVLGGMGPAAGAEFMRLLARDAPAERDRDHPRVIMLSEPSIPDRTQSILGHGEDPSPMLRRGLERLVEWGADVLAVPCNTAHFFIDSFRGELSVPLIHIVEATINSAASASPDGAWLLCTSGTRASGLYQKYASKRGYRFIDPSDGTQEKVQRCVDLVKAGRLDRAGALMRGIAEELWGMDDRLITTACTELPLAYAASGLPPRKEISSLQALSDACLKFLYAD